MKSVITTFVIIALCLAPFSTVNAKPRPVVRLNNGTSRIRGTVLRSLKGKEYYGFQAIPYAKAPIGELRFKKPEPAVPWKGLRDGGKRANGCTQYFAFLSTYVGKEDCLYLNIHTPQHSNDAIKPLRPVLVFLHGGSFQMGFISKLFYNPGKFMDQNDVVFVMLNSRLDVLGFLSTEDDVSPGNYGLWDIIEGLKWIQKNIQHFGGDPSRITLMGQSSGGMAASLLTLSDHASGLFHRVILQSGAFTNAGVLQKTPLRAAQRLAEILGCPRNTNKDMVACFRKMKDIDLIKGSVSLGKEPKYFTLAPNLVFLPTTVGTQKLLPARAEEKVLNNEITFINKVPLLMGNTANEGLFLVEAAKKFFSDWGENIEAVIRHYIEFYGKETYGDEFEPSNVNLALDRIKQEYFCDPDENIKKDPVLYNRLKGMVFTDFGIVLSSKKFASFWANQNLPTHFYIMKYVGRHTHLQEDMGVKKVLDASHGDESFYLFDLKRLRGDDEIFSQRLLSIWTNFAKAGIPNVVTTSMEKPVKWETFDDKDQYYVEMNKTFATKSHYRPRADFFWNVVFHKILSGQILNEEDVAVVNCMEYLP